MFGPDPIEEMQKKINLIKYGKPSITMTDPLDQKAYFISMLVGLTSPNTPE